ncbi:MAG TPA: hypothetical protein VGG25_19055 [Streptosporangiaceae bacterium]
MSDRSGLGLVELAVLETLDSLTDGRPRAVPASSRITAEVERKIGLGPRYSYEVLLDLARHWTVPLRLVSFRGNYGSADDAASDPQYTQCRLTDAGKVALAAEAGQIGPVPIGLINGSVYCGGTRPPLEPFRVIAALRRLLANPSTTDSQIVEAVGPPDFMTGCAVTGDLEALVAGRPTLLQLTSRIEITDKQRLIVSALPPGVSAFEVAQAVASLQAPRSWAHSPPRPSEKATLPITDVDPQPQAGAPGADASIVVTLAPGANCEAVCSQLMEVDGIVREVAAAFPAPLSVALRSWLDRADPGTVMASLNQLEDASRSDEKRLRKRGRQMDSSAG